MKRHGRQTVVLLENGRERADHFVPVDVLSPAWTMGRSLFETMLVLPYPASKPLLAPQDHARRLITSSRHLGWQGVPAEHTLIDWMKAAATSFRRRWGGWGRMRLTVAWTRDEKRPGTYVVVVPYTRPKAPARVGVTPVTIPWSDSWGAPKSGNRLIYEWAGEWARSRGFDEGLLCDHRGAPVEGARSNIFLIQGTELATPPLSAGVLPGIMRDMIMATAADEGFFVRQRIIPYDEWAAGVRAGCVFLTNALWGVRWVSRLDGHRAKCVASQVIRLAQAYQKTLEASLYPC